MSTNRRPSVRASVTAVFVVMLWATLISCQTDRPTGATAAIKPESSPAVHVTGDYQVHILEPAVTNHFILPDAPLPPNALSSSKLTLHGCRGQYGSLSFVVTAAKSLENVQVDHRPVQGEGITWPDDAVDVRVVKAYHRGCYSRPTAMPTLLVHDESFLAIEPAPTEKDPDRLTNVAVGPLRDAESLQPTNIPQRKQFWVTVQIPRDAKTGSYQTTLNIIPKNSEPTSLTLSIHVYPFDLLPPMIEYSIYYPAYLDAGYPDGHYYKFAEVTADQMLAEFRNMKEHGLDNPNMYDAPRMQPDGTLDFTKVDRVLELRHQAGMRPRTLYLLGHNVPFTDKPLTDEQRARTDSFVKQTNAWARSHGYEEVYYAANDEWWGEQLSAERDSMLAVEDAGGKTFVAVMHTTFFERVGDALTCPVLQSGIGAQLEHASKGMTPQQWLRNSAQIAKAGSFKTMVDDPKFREGIDGLHRRGRKIFTYMNPTAGVALPELHRRNTGLGMWRVGFDGTMTWAYAHIAGDRINQSVGFAMIYRTENGVLDTLHWEGFREGVNDVRYLTTLQAELSKAAGRFPDHPLIRDTHAWLATIDAAEGDLDAVRHEMAQRIIAVQNLGYRRRSTEELLAELDLNEITFTTLEDPWRFKVDPDDLGVDQKWFDPAVDIALWAPIHTGIDTGWEKQGFAEDEVGYGWYRTELPITKAQLKKKYKYLFFGANDEDSWVYLNGRLVFSHDFEHTGIVPSVIWLTSFVVPLTDEQLRGRDALAVRVLNTGGLGGVWKPVHLIVSDQKLSFDHIKALVESKNTNLTP